MSELVLTVNQINNYIKNIFEAEEMLIGVKVVGEITNLKQSGKAVYFDLKDDQASIPCVVFDSYIIGGFQFGDKVSVKGKLNYYTKGGRLSFVVSKIEKYGIGDLYKEYLEYSWFEIIEQDVVNKINYNKEVDYVIHAASYAAQSVEGTCSLEKRLS